MIDLDCKVTWWDGDRYWILLGAEVGFTCRPRRDDHHVSGTLYLPRASWSFYSGRWPILGIEYAPGHSGGLRHCWDHREDWKW